MQRNPVIHCSTSSQLEAWVRLGFKVIGYAWLSAGPVFIVGEA